MKFPYPRKTKKNRRRTTLRREGWLFLGLVVIVLAGALMQKLNLLLILCGMLAGPLFISWRAVAVMLRGLQCQRQLPQHVWTGDTWPLHLSLVNLRRYSCWSVEVEDQIAHEDGKPLDSGLWFPHVAAGKTQTKALQVRLTRRGRYRIGPMRIATSFPFGLVRRTRTIDSTETLIVLPRLGSLNRRWFTRQHESFDGSTRHRVRRGRGDELFFGVREWHYGDSRRWIHWRSSARRGELVVRQFERPHHQNVAILLDLWQPPNADPQHRGPIELAVSFAATLVVELCRHEGAHLLVDSTDINMHNIQGAASVALMQKILEQLAVVEPDSTDRLSALFERAGKYLDRNARVILISTRNVDPTDANFTGSCSDERRASIFHNIECINTASDDLTQCFQVN